MELIHHICERDISKQKQNNRLNMGVKTKNFRILKQQRTRSGGRKTGSWKLQAARCARNWWSQSGSNR